MKKLMLIAAAFATLVSCTKTQVIPTETAQQEISMKAYNQAAVKATGPVNATSLTDRDESMSIYGYYANNGTYNSTAYLSDATFSYDGSNWKGGTNIKNGENYTFTPNAYYWPSTGTMKFIAVYPKSSWTSISSTYETSEAGTTTTITNVNLATRSEQKDIMYSNSLYISPVPCPVTQSPYPTLTFEHLLSQIAVNIDASIDNKVTLLNVVISGINTNGSITITEAKGLNERTIDYTITTTNGSFDCLDSELTLTSSNTFSTSDLLVLPTLKTTGTTTAALTTTGSPTLTIIYNIDGNSTSIEKSIELGPWQQGKKYTYNVNIALNEIIFNTSVTEWDSTSSGTTIISSI